MSKMNRNKQQQKQTAHTLVLGWKSQELVGLRAEGKKVIVAYTQQIYQCGTEVETTYKILFPPPYSGNANSWAYKPHMSWVGGIGTLISLLQNSFQKTGTARVTYPGTEQNTGFSHAGGWCQLAGTWGWLVSRRRCLAWAPVRGNVISWLLQMRRWGEG